jgi:sec-independent protein translocase protein TatA
MDLGMGEVLLVLVVALLIYGGRLPEVARSLGRSLAAFKRSLQETTDSVTREVNAAIDLEEEGRPRTVRRVPAAPETPSAEALATEDVSGEPAAVPPAAGNAPPTPAAPSPEAPPGTGEGPPSPQS